MANLGISEFSFGYAFLHEQTVASWGQLRAAPVLPSLQQEEKEGWDVKVPLIGTDFYYQFKVSEVLDHHWAKYIEDDTYNDEYFQLKLHRKNANQQHRRLKELSKVCPNTYYVAPEFQSRDAFNDAFLNNQVVANTRFFPLTRCKDLLPTDSEQHCITWQSVSDEWIFHSKPERSTYSVRGDDLPRFYRSTHNTWRKIDAEFADELLSKAHKLTSEHMEVPDTVRGIALADTRSKHGAVIEKLSAASKLLSAAFGVTLTIVGVD